MRCQEIETNADALLSGRIEASQRDAITSHVDACPRCSKLIEDVRAIRSSAASLPRELAPSRDLWPSIRAQMASTRTSGHPLAVAAALFAALAASILLVSERPRVLPPPRDTASSPSMAEMLDKSFGPTRDVLVQRLAAQRQRMAPDQARDLDRNLGSFTRAIDALRAALATEPGSTRLVFQLCRTYRAQIRFLVLVTEPEPVD